jgi:hypothetical protein
MSPLPGLVIMNFTKSINMPSLAGLAMVTPFRNSPHIQPRSGDMFIEKMVSIVLNSGGVTCEIISEEFLWVFITMKKLKISNYNYEHRY